MHLINVIPSPPNQIHLNVRSKLIIAVGVVFLIICFFGPSSIWNWDPSFYYAQLRAPIIDHDIDFSNEVIVSQGIKLSRTATGLVGSIWPVGPSILWSPFFILAHIIVSVFQPEQANGFSPIYISMVSFGSGLYSFIGLWFIYKICLFFVKTKVARILTLGCLLATPLFYYTFRQPIMAHSTNLCVSAIIIYFYLKYEKSNQIAQSGLTFGILLGLSFLTRWSSVIIGIYPFIFFAQRLSKSSRHNSEFNHTLKQALIAGLTFFITILPQLVLWQRLYGTWLTSPQGANSFVSNILPVNIIHVILNTNRGIMWWLPFVLIGIFGIFLIEERIIRYTTLIYISLIIILLGYRKDWYSGGGFGARYFIETLPVVAISWSYIWKTFSRWQFMLIILVGLCSFHQFSLMLAVEQGRIPLNLYFSAQPIELTFHIKNMIDLITHPILLLKPRLNVLDSHNAILVNVVSGNYERENFIIPTTALLLSSIFLILSNKIWVWARNHQYLMWSLILILINIWSLIFLIV